MTALPPGPTLSPLVQKLYWIFDPLRFMDACRDRYGDTFTVQLGRSARPMILFSHPDAIQEMFRTPAKHFDTGRANQILKPLLGPRSLELLDGHHHDRHRKIMLPKFQRSRLQVYGDLIQRKTRSLVQTWQPGHRFNARDCLQLLSFETMSEIVFGTADVGLQRDIYQCFDRLFQWVSQSPMTSLRLFFPNVQPAWLPLLNRTAFRQTRSDLDQHLYQMIASCRERQQAHGDDPSLLCALMQAQDQQGRPLSDQELQSELMTLLFAGHETIASALAWTLYRIFSAPGCLQRVQQELADSTGRSTNHDRASLPYLNAVISETLRIYPIGLILFPRVVKKSMTLGGYPLPKGTVITGSIYLTHHRPELYPSPQNFQPERFLNHAFAAHEYYPFGGGNRRCLGSVFAPFMIQRVMAEIVQNWTLKVCDRTPLRPQRRGVTTAPQGGVSMQVVAPASHPHPAPPTFALPTP